MKTKLDFVTDLLNDSAAKGQEMRHRKSVKDDVAERICNFLMERHGSEVALILLCTEEGRMIWMYPAQQIQVYGRCLSADDLLALKETLHCSDPVSYTHLYGRYVDDDMDIATDFITVNVVQLTICLISGFVVIPAVVAFGLDPFIGKGLLFVSLPTVFATIPGGSIFLILFFIALMFAGISSSLNQVEIPVQALMDEEGFGMSRKKAVLTCVVIAVLIAIPCVWNDAFFAVFDNVIGNIMYTFDAAALAIVLAWKVGAKTVREEWYLPTSAVKWGRPIDYMYKYVAVICLVYFTITAVISLF